jgi:predicted XRE-type DNA-binding protein
MANRSSKASPPLRGGALPRVVQAVKNTLTATAPKAKPAGKNATKSLVKTANVASNKSKPLQRVEAMKAVATDAQKQADEGYMLAKRQAAAFLHGRRQAMFALARQYHVDIDDLAQEGYEVLLTCLRDFNPLFTRADGQQVTVQFNTFFGSRLENKALELRNRDPEYQARQAHMAEMSAEDREDFRKNPPLLVQHLDQESTLQEHLSAEVSSAKRRSGTNLKLKLAEDSFVEQKLNALIAAERDDKRRAALQHVKLGGVASFEEIAYHFGVTDSRASQILNELMDAFYTQRLLDGDVKGVQYDFQKLDLQPKRRQRMLEEALSHAAPERRVQLLETFGTEFPDLRNITNASPSGIASGNGGKLGGPLVNPPLTPEEEAHYPLLSLEWREINTLVPLTLGFRAPDTQAPEADPWLKGLLTTAPEEWPPLLITPSGEVLDGLRRLTLARGRGLTRVLCQVRGVEDLNQAQQLRIALNARARVLEKLDLYYLISALTSLNLSQGKIADLLGTSRPNVIVYSKVRAKASARLRQLFEDELIQITNASSAVDLPAHQQDELADFIRQFGSEWGRGVQFSEAYEAVVAGQLAQLASAQVPTHARPGVAYSAPMPSAPPSNVALNGLETAGNVTSLAPGVAKALKQRQETMETALRDAEVWARSREATIAQQTNQLQDLQQKVAALKSELQATQLLPHSDASTLAALQKENQKFYGLTERLAAAVQHVQAVQAALQGVLLSQRQKMELEALLEQLATAAGGLQATMGRRS